MEDKSPHIIQSLSTNFKSYTSQVEKASSIKIKLSQFMPSYLFLILSLLITKNFASNSKEKLNFINYFRPFNKKPQFATLKILFLSLFCNQEEYSKKIKLSPNLTYPNNVTLSAYFLKTLSKPNLQTNFLMFFLPKISFLNKIVMIKSNVKKVVNKSKNRTNLLSFLVSKKIQ